MNLLQLRAARSLGEFFLHVYLTNSTNVLFDIHQTSLNDESQATLQETADGGSYFRSPPLVT